MKNKWTKSYLLLILAVLYAPIFYLVFFSFNKSGDMSKFTGFSWEAFHTLFADDRLLVIVLETFFLAFLSAAFATLIGGLGAIYLSNSSSRKRSRLLALNNILLVSPDVIIGATFLIFFTTIGLPLGFFSVLISHIAFSIPIVVLMILPQYRGMDPAIVDAAYDLGATKQQALWRVVLPYLTPGIIAGFFMAFTFSLDDFAVTFFVTGNGFSTLAVEIYSRARQGISLEINALSTLVFLFSILLVAGYYFISRGEQMERKTDKEVRQ